MHQVQVLLLGHCCFSVGPFLSTGDAATHQQPVWHRFPRSGPTPPALRGVPNRSPTVALSEGYWAWSLELRLQGGGAWGRPDWHEHLKECARRCVFEVLPCLSCRGQCTGHRHVPAILGARGSGPDSAEANSRGGRHCQPEAVDCMVGGYAQGTVVVAVHCAQGRPGPIVAIGLPQA